MTHALQRQESFRPQKVTLILRASPQTRVACHVRWSSAESVNKPPEGCICGENMGLLKHHPSSSSPRRVSTESRLILGSNSLLNKSVMSHTCFSIAFTDSHMIAMVSHISSCPDIALPVTSALPVINILSNTVTQCEN